MDGNCSNVWWLRSFLPERRSSQRSWEDLERTPGEPVDQRHVLPHLQKEEREKSNCKEIVVPILTSFKGFQRVYMNVN